MIEHIGTIIARVGADIAAKQARWLQHDYGCPCWNKVVPTDCNCSARPVIDLLLTIAQRKAA
jgi:hypothetical protein